MPSIVALIKMVAVIYPTFIILFTVRGFFYALAATIAGDEGPREQGFLTLNPLAHVDVLGSLAAAILFAVWQKVPGVGLILLVAGLFLLRLLGMQTYYPVFADQSMFRHPRLGVLAVTLFSIMSYFLVALFANYVLLWGHYLLGLQSPVFGILMLLAQSLIRWAVTWMALSLIPLPPFEAAGLLPVFFGQTGQDIYDALEPYGLLIFFSLLWLPGVRDVFSVCMNIIHIYTCELLMYLSWVPQFIQ